MEIFTHRIRKTFVLSPLVEALSHRRTFFLAFRLAFTTLRFFFYPQFETRFFPKRRPVVAVDHPLDALVPFKPGLVDEYLTFFFLWINTALYFSRAGGGAGVEAFRDWIKEMTGLYHDCGAVYLRCQSTTERPQDAANSRFSIIHSLDPHLHCVPSLHILIVVANWVMAERHAALLGGGERAARAVAYARQEALRITESVLFVKQHSANCVAVSLFLLRVRFPEFGDGRALACAESLFSYDRAGEEAERAIRDHVRGLYSRLWDGYAARGDGDWKAVVMEYLLTFEPKAPWIKNAAGRFSLGPA
jgi:hypothetical protein